MTRPISCCAKSAPGTRKKERGKRRDRVIIVGITLYRQPILIYNPIAGRFRRNPELILKRTTEALRRVGIDPHLAPSRSAGHATKLARQAVEYGSDLVLVLGGDGTINEVACGMAHSSAALGVLPAGTANVLAMELKLGSNLEKAAAGLATAVPRRIAIGCLETGEGLRYFLCMAGAGLDAKIVAGVSPRLKAAWGKAAYWIGGFQQFFGSIKPLEVEVAGKSYRCGFALVSRVANYGGDLEIASGASLTRDDFELVLFEGSNPLRYAGYMLAVGLKRVQKMPGVTTLAATEVELAGGTDLQIDGEYAGRSPARLTIVRDALTLLMPAT